MHKPIKISYIGGGSRQWARNLMSDLALEPDLTGTVILYDIDYEAAVNNAIIGNMMMELPEAKGKWNFIVAKTLEESLVNADFVFISILPATFEEMKAYAHIPEKWGIYQTVGDTVGPAGIFRALIMMPIYEEIVLAVKNICPNAWVINFTNPMTMCVQTLYHVFPEIKAFGNCHEVFHVQDIIARALKEKTGIVASRKDIEINPLGINHFTWINYASYKDIDLMPIYKEFVEKYHKDGLGKDEWETYYPFGSGERVKFDLFKKSGVIAAAGDRHLVEFLPQSWYLKDKKTIHDWHFFLTPVNFRMKRKEEANETALRIIRKEEKIKIEPSGEEGILQLKALLGLSSLLTNVNIINKGQIPNLPLGHVVETNALFRRDEVRPIYSGPMPDFPLEFTRIHIQNHKFLLQAFDENDLSYARYAFHQDPLVKHLLPQDLDLMFDEIVEATEPYLSYYKK
ncbi:MAG: alpha-glucosidase/alpha-galactosidase [Acholeplasmataceae bacterium]|nr:alpha-glucosidase/alpha-galactosidase [Acholeplasmataceae bacterium]